MVLPDVAPIPPESLVEFVLWIWLCVTLGLTVNLGVQLLLAPGDPLTLLLRELDARLRAVENTVRELAGATELAPPPTGMSLDALATAGMSRPLALLKTASLTNAVARQRHETLATTITLVDRLVTDAGALRLLASSTSITPMRDSLLRVADGCADTRRAVAERRWPEPSAAAPPSASTPPPLADMERTLEQLSVVSRIEPPKPTTKEPGPHLLLPDATTNPEYVQFAVKGALAALICYVLFIGFDYPGIYTSVITCFVVSLSTIGSSNQKGLLRFGGAAVGGALSHPPGDVDARRRLISQQVTDVQGFIESSKYESGTGAGDAQTVERRTADAQTVFLVLLAIAREATAAARPPEALHTATIRVDDDVAAILDGVAARVRNDGAAPVVEVDRALAALERSLAAQAHASGDGATYAGALSLYRELAVAVTRVASEGEDSTM